MFIARRKLTSRSIIYAKLETVHFKPAYVIMRLFPALFNKLCSVQQHKHDGCVKFRGESSKSVSKQVSWSFAKVA